MPSRWQPPPAPPWSLADQCTAAGLDAPVLERSRDGQAWRFTEARVLAHHCRTSACEYCAAAKRSGYTAIRVTRDSVRTGEALHVIGRALWAAGAQKGLFGCET